MTDWLSYGIGIGAIVIATAAIFLGWRWRRDDHSLLQETKVLVTALGPAVEGIETQIQKLRSDLKSTNRAVSSIQRAGGGGQFGATAQVVVGPPKPPSGIAARQIRLQQAQALKEQRFRWKQTKDLAKALRWVFERLDEDEED
jgi:hypothetical protein